MVHGAVRWTVGDSCRTDGKTNLQRARATYRAPRHRQEIEIEIEPPQRALHHALLSSSVRFGLRRYCQCLGIGVGINERIIKAIDVSANQSTFDC